MEGAKRPTAPVNLGQWAGASLAHSPPSFWSTPPRVLEFLVRRHLPGQSGAGEPRNDGLSQQGCGGVERAIETAKSDTEKVLSRRRVRVGRAVEVQCGVLRSTQEGCGRLTRAFESADVHSWAESS